MTEKKVVEFKDVVKEYGEGDGKQIAVNHVDFSINEGEFVVILGQSGAGKSTVLNMLGGMDSPTSGEIIVDDAEVSKMNDKQLSDYRAKKIGFIFQFYNLIPSLTAYENVALTKSIVKDALDPIEMLERVGLKDHAKKFPSQMSGGEQQRVSIARALAKNPKIILGDEPTGALDSETGVIVLKLLIEMSHKYSNTVIVVTHNADIAKCADKVIRMKNGRIREIKINEAPLSVEEVEW
ncbi:MAG: ABC transporter ATP-binding protein [Lachnospiraceae bacterium]|nr:ABC transporter ATP-binding protein [Lachnospiraceae bacterium]